MRAPYVKWWIYRGAALVATLMQTTESGALELAALMTQISADHLIAEKKERK
jgi:hypothetical protein